MRIQPLDNEDIIRLQACMNTSTHDFLVLLLQLVKERSSVREMAEILGVGRESLYKSLSATGNPSFHTIAQILEVLNVEINFKEIHPQDK